MASPITTSTGLGSGLDIGSIVTALVASDTAAQKSQITTQTADVASKLSGIGQLQSAMAAYQAALTKLGDPQQPPQFPAYGATSSNATTLSATTDNTAVPGTYSIVVGQLATGSKIASAAFAGGAASAIPTGTLTISQNGTAHNLTVPSGATLQSVRDAINADAGMKTAGISANIVTDGNGSRLVFGSSVTGAGSDMTVSGIAGLAIDGTQKMDGTATGSGYMGAIAQDAKFTVDGLAITSKSNTVTPVGGMSMTLLAGAGATSIVTVAQNTAGLQTSLQTFVTAYNALMTTLNTLTAPGVADPTTGVVSGGGAMNGDSLPRTLIASLRTQLVTPGPGSQLSVLSQLGIKTQQTDGTLSFDATSFSSAMTKNAQLGSQVQDMFTGTNSTNGLLARMGAVLTPYTQTGGILATRSSSLNQQQSDLSNQQADLTQRTSDLTAQLTAKYNAMDLVVGQLKATASSITSFFASLNAQKSG
ncbi:flagellar filament capping protein FliD [Pseudomonas sp. NA-150]|uniref:flagellar filament capping protein FliD n=1 Tax=Pseudomonas sp. NA-150 TaxID=3367525 RepID=UPI0037CC413F